MILLEKINRLSKICKSRMNIADVFSATQTGETSKRVFSSEKIPEITNIHARMNLDCYLCNVKNANQMK